MVLPVPTTSSRAEPASNGSRDAGVQCGSIHATFSASDTQQHSPGDRTHSYSSNESSTTIYDTANDIGEKTTSNHQKTWLVDFDGPDDPEKPMNFSKVKKCLVVALPAACTFCVSFASSIFSTCTTATATEFHVSEEVMILGVSLYVAGFAFGPLLWGPLSERFGRYPPVFAGLVVFVLFQIPLAVAQNLETIFLSRFFAGLFGAAPLGICSASYVDILDVVDRGIAYSIFAASVFLGPVIGPIVGSFITQSHLGWRWTAWLTLIISGTCTILGIFFVPETSVPVILQRKAARRRIQTREWAWHAQLDEQPPALKSVVQNYLYKPWKMLSREPILVAMTLYISTVYALLYLIFFAYPIAFRDVRGWQPQTASLSFLSLMIGVIAGCFGMAMDSRTRLAKRLKTRRKHAPEDRLPVMIVGGVLLPVGLFWFAWTSSSHITFWPQMISGIPIGAGITTVFFSGLLYLVDVYLGSAASALAINSFLRSMCAAAFPLFATYMYVRLGVAWATTLLAFICSALVPIPVLFYCYGHLLRKRGTFTTKS